jgi:pimeloyl-ACP methyl ester carboxylesterase
MVRQSQPQARRLAWRWALRFVWLIAVLLGLATSCLPSAPPSRPAPVPTPTAQMPAPPVGDTAPTPGHPVLSADGLRVPSQLDPARPLPVLLALHGMGGTGPRIARRLEECAARHGWLLVAPSIAYRDHLDPEQIRLDGQENLPRLRALLGALPDRLGVRLAEKILVYGFSRGGQMAHRLALFYPETVAGVAVVAAGSYTLPWHTSLRGGLDQPLPFPFGVADLQRYAGRPFDARALRGVPFWVGVGATDTAREQVPRPWDPYVGSTRLERAKRFSRALQGLGAAVSLDVFSGAGHEETGAMRSRACEFLARHAPARAR